MKLLCIRDAAAGIYMGIFTSISTGTAIRDFAQEVNNPQSMMQKAPGDYELYEMGEFDNETGKMIVITPRSVARASDYHKGEIENEAKFTTPR